jgi:polyisoprenoid-binding protein YceI
MTGASFLRRPRTWVIGIPVVVVLAVVVGPFVYINFVRDDPPPRLSFADVTTSAPGSRGSSSTAGLSSSVPSRALDGAWTVAEGSQAGYRVDEILFGQAAEAVGRTSDVSGEMVLAGTTVESATVVVDLTTVRSDEDRRDNQFHGRIMDTATFPTATFELAEPLALGALPDDLAPVTVGATGDFTIRGVTRRVAFELVARRNGERIEVNGAIPVTFADYGIPEPSFGPATVEDHGEVELLVVFTRA